MEVGSVEIAGGILAYASPVVLVNARTNQVEDLLPLEDAI